MNHAAACAANLQALRERRPLIHNIANLVSMEVVANALLALGASPAMVHAEPEVEEFVGLADALVVNLGTLSPAWIPAMLLAATRAAETGTPWVLDPVGCGATRHRTATAVRLAELGPTVIRANATEILALAGAADRPTRGVDSSHPAHAAVATARELAGQRGSVVAITGTLDHITDGNRTLTVANGDPRMTQVTALGCVASAVIGTFLAAEPDPLAAAAHGLAVVGLAGERAAARSTGPGSLRVGFIDELAALNSTLVTEGARIS